MAQSQEPSPSKKPNQSNSYVKYSSLAFQLLAVIGIFGWLGYKIDGWMDNKFPAFTLVLGFAGFGGMMYQIYRSINRQ
jgi:hypothetical protein